MNDILSLFIVMFLAYSLQCVAGAPQGTVVVYVDSRLRGRLLRHFWPVGRSQYRLFILNPFLYFSGVVYADKHPFSFLVNSSDEICGAAFGTPEASGSLATQFTFDILHRFTARSKELVVDDNLVSTLHSEYSASRFAAFLDKVQAASPSDRRSIVDRELRTMFAVNVLKKRLQLFSRSTVLINSLCFSLFIFLFLITPANIYVFGLRRLWPVLLMVLVIFSLAILWTFRRAHGRLYPAGNTGRFEHLLAIGLFPFAAIRATDLLMVDLCADFHPVTVACALLPRDEFLRLAKNELSRIRFVTQDHILEEYIKGLLSTQQVDLECLLKPPQPDDQRSRTYCPVCLTQYTVEEGTCSDCEGLSLQPLLPPNPK